MPKTSTNADRKCETRFRVCGWCNTELPRYARSHAKYCSDRCRHYARIQRGNTAKVYRAQKLKNGKISIVIHVEKATLTAGDVIKWSRDTD